MLSFIILASLAAVRLSPVWILSYILLAAFLYGFTALFFDLPLPGSRRRVADDDAPPPEYHGRGGNASRKRRRTRPER
ncbi:MAG TPA: hypothetical protein VGR27_01235 [Longimicrobiaceae bacterium]|nr:hypothetical protein [Longimicrobiaceae bacterium]